MNCIPLVLLNNLIKQSTPLKLSCIQIWPNMTVKGTFCPSALFKHGASSSVSGFCYHHPRAKRPLLLRYCLIVWFRSLLKKLSNDSERLQSFNPACHPSNHHPELLPPCRIINRVSSGRDTLVWPIPVRFRPHLCTDLI
jgi:hypothetical protein